MAPRATMATSRIVLCGLSSRFAGLRWEAEGCLRIGRLEYMELILSHPSVSRRHAEIQAGPQGWMVRDLDSSNGTFLNDVRIGQESLRVKLDDVIRCREIQLKVVALEEEIAPPAPAAPPPAAIPPIKTSRTYVRVQAVSQNSWEDALQVLEKSSPDQGPREDVRLQAMIRTGQHLCNAASLDELLQSILNDAVSVLRAQRGCIVLVDEATSELHLRVVGGPNANQETERFFSKTLINRSFERGESLLCQDVHLDDELRRTGTITRGTMSSIVCALLRTPRRRLGVLHLDRGPDQNPFRTEDFHLADAIAACVSTGIESAQLIEIQREQAIHTVTALAQAVELRDQYTGGHTQRVTTYALMLAEELKLSPNNQRQLKIGTPLHDIGKIGIYDAVLRKAGKLTEAEFEHMKTHTLKGAAIVESIPNFANLIPIIRSHHERWDGRGYPDGLAKEQISRLARVVAVADAFDAMTSNRPYRMALPMDRAFAEIGIKAGTHFDPEIAQAFLRLRPAIQKVLSQQSHDRTFCEPAIQTYSRAQLKHLQHEENLLFGAAAPSLAAG